MMLSTLSNLTPNVSVAAMTSTQDQLVDAVNQLATLMDIVTEKFTFVRRLTQSLSNGDLEEHTGRRGKRGPRQGSKPPRTRAAARTIAEEAVLDYFRTKGPMNVKGMANDLELTTTMAHKRVKELLAAKALKRVKEGNRVMYMITPRGKKARKSASDAS